MDWQTVFGSPVPHCFWHSWGIVEITLENVEQKTISGKLAEHIGIHKPTAGFGSGDGFERLFELVPGLGGYRMGTCPEYPETRCGTYRTNMSVANWMIHFNDDHRWTWKDILAWMEERADLNVVEPEGR